MGQSADELRRDIEDTRYGLSDTLDAIGDRVSPGRVIERRKNRAIHGVQSVRDRVMGSVTGTRDSIADTTGSAVDAVKGTPDALRQQTQGSPLAAAAIAFGVGFLVAAVFPASQPEQHAAQALIDKAEPLKDELTTIGTDVAQHVKADAQQAIQDVKTTATDSTQAVAATVKDGIEATKTTSQDAAATVKHQTSS